MLRYSYTAMVRAFDILKAHEKCNGQITIQGSSQGAGLALVLAGLRDAELAQGTAMALCRIDWTVLGHTRWGPRCPPDADPQQVAQVVRYYDPASFAHRIRTPLKFAIGLFDYCAPAEGVFSAINALPATTPCEMLIDPYAGHFNIDASDFHNHDELLQVPRWEGSDDDNKLVR